MKRMLVAIGMLLVIGTCAGGTWRLARSPLTPFLIPGASGIQVVNAGLGEWQIDYAAPGPPYAWYWTVARTLEAQHWTPRDRWSPESSPTYNPVVPLRFELRYGGLLWDEVVLDPDDRNPTRARIQLRRQIALRWWQAYSSGQSAGDSKQ